MEEFALDVVWNTKPALRASLCVLEKVRIYFTASFKVFEARNFGTFIVLI